MKLPLALLFCAAALPAQTVKPATAQAFDCYIQSAEARLQPVNLTPALEEQLVRGQKVVTIPGNGANPHKVPGAMLYDWIGLVFIPGVTVDRTVRMLQDYDHRAQYFSEIVATSRLLCRTGEDRFRFTMQLKEPAVIDTENDVVWERLDSQHWRCRSYSTKVQEIGKQHNYLSRLNSYWSFTETGKGVYVQGETITLSGEFGSLMRTLGSMMGINPEKSLKRSLEQMRESQLKPGAEFPKPPAGLPGCGEPTRAGGCTVVSSR